MQYSNFHKSKIKFAPKQILNRLKAKDIAITLACQFKASIDIIPLYTSPSFKKVNGEDY